MPRVLTCVDPVPAVDGSCSQQAWVEQSTLADYLPTVAEANEIGFSFFASLMVLTAVKHFFKPRRL